MASTPTLSFTSTTPGTSADYLKYLYDQPIKTDRDSDSILLDFTLAATDSSFVKLNRGNYIKFNSITYPTWFTGYITNEPEYQYLGEKAGVPYWGYKYEASSDEIILSQNALGFLPPFINMTQGAILKALANIIAPGLFDYTNVDDGQLLARYVVDPTKKFADITKEFCDAAVFRFFGQGMCLFFTSKADIPQGFTIDGNDQRFTPSDLQVKASADQPIINDAVVVGDIEPKNYVTEYFVGDGSTGAFPLSASIFGVSSTVLLTDDFTGGGSGFDNTIWTEYDQPSDFIQNNNGFCNFLGGSANGSYDVHLDSANLIPISGNLRITHGDYDFVPQSSDNLTCGVIGGLWTQAPNSAFTGCLYGIRVSKASGVVTIRPIVNGVVDMSRYATIDTTGLGGGTPAAWSAVTTYSVGQKVSYSGNYYEAVAPSYDLQPDANPAQWALVTAPRYVLRTVIGTRRIFRFIPMYSYLDKTGHVISTGSAGYTDIFGATTYITELDPNTGLISAGWPQVWNSTMPVDITQLFTTYIPGASNDLHVTITNVTISTPMQAQLSIASAGMPGDWDSGTTYGISALATFNGVVYRSLQNTNTNNEPDTSPTYWTVTLVSPVPKSTIGTFANKIVGPNEVDSCDGLSPFATIAVDSSSTSKQNLLGTRTYNYGHPTLTFFKDSNRLDTTVPQIGDIIRVSYRSAGSAIGRVRDADSVAEEATNWGDNGVRSSVRFDLAPAPLTSEECESAAAAIIGQNAYTHYEGSYSVPSVNVSSEPLAGSILSFVNLPSGVFDLPDAGTSFNEPIYEVVSTFVASRGQELFEHNISFGLKGDSQRLRTQLAQYKKQTDVFAPPDTAEIPDFVPVASVGTAYAPDVPHLALSLDTGHLRGVDATLFYYDAGQTCPSGGGFEIRYSDASWGTSDSSNLVARTSSQTFTLPRIMRNRIIFLKAYDNSTPRLYSRYASCVRCAYPGTPQEPTAIQGGTAPANVTFTQTTNIGYTSRGTYNSGTAYVAGDVVEQGGSSYVALNATTGNDPSDTSHWQLLASAGTGATWTAM